jgi:hypothetical protein
LYLGAREPWLWPSFLLCLPPPPQPQSCSGTWDPVLYPQKTMNWAG